MNTDQEALRQKNARANLTRLLEIWSEKQSQIAYQQAVPFVHVPNELLAQWEAYANLLKQQQKWFIASLNERELSALGSFDEAVEAFENASELPDVPEIFQFPGWLALMSKAGELLLVLKLNA